MHAFEVGLDLKMEVIEVQASAANQVRYSGDISPRHLEDTFRRLRQKGNNELHSCLSCHSPTDLIRVRGTRQQDAALFLFDMSRLCEFVMECMRKECGGRQGTRGDGG